MKKCVAVCLLLVTLILSSCYYIDSKDVSKYDSFVKSLESKKSHIYSILPRDIEDSCIKDIYLYYNERDLTDNLYTVYLNCVYTADQYKQEQSKIYNIAKQWDFADYNTDDFIYESIAIDQYLSFSKENYGCIDYSYILFDEPNNRIVYVFIFEKVLDGKSCEVPAEYLPQDLISLRKARYGSES